ncbi:MAG: hypothetical protein JSU72_12415 [Deltaproteobacteria bacterium]|nr:MAG: hypothetical protein JSU72_12415 [Deltaproteobacteria bacterium]
MGEKLVHFDDVAPLPPIKSVGGKGYSLIRMSREGFPVPPGFVLTVDFFTPWIEAVTAADQWQDFINAPPEEMTERAAVLPSLADNLSFNDEQARFVSQALERMEGFELFAVRSSSPEEDLAGASFAGGYETILGAGRETMERAVRQAFESCLSPRVFVYKRQQGFEINQARIAVVVQAQIASEVAGVGFSVEPISNDYDRAVFNANWGLGETVVSGLASPDQYVVDKVSGQVLEAVIGQKETSIWLRPDGGTEERPDSRHDQPTLDHDRLTVMTRELIRVEELYGRPMDIEWAWRDGRFYLLQARPITAYLPMPEDMVTSPGRPRRLYLDATLAIQGIQEPLSVMGQDFLHILFRNVSRELLGHEKLVDPDEGLVRMTGNRFYLSLSHLFHVVSPKSFGRVIGNMDSLVGEILLQIDPESYLSHPGPEYLHHLGPKIVTHVPALPIKALEAALIPEYSAEVYHRQVGKTLAGIEADKGAPQKINEYTDWLAARYVHLLFHTLVPPFVAAMLARSRLSRIFADRAKEESQTAQDLVYIDQALPHNITIEMGLELYAIAENLAGLGVSDPEDLGRRLETADLPPEVMEAWQAYMEHFGFRGPRELDIAAPRYRDRPELLYKQILSLLSLEKDSDNPRAIHKRSAERRHQAHARLRDAAYNLGAVTGREYDLLYRLVVHFGGYRENHKYYLVKAISFLRRRVLQEVEGLLAAGRLDRLDQVFDLTLDDLARALDDPAIDLRELIERNTAFLQKLHHVKEFPHMVDSRGRILRPQRPEPKEGELAGQAISPGRTQGRVKVLHTPDEKPLLPGDILVARATDPGWTPLFVNAVAIVLEVGGMLQHGSLVAREYGKPCVAGVQNATNLLKDDEMVEVDGSAGLIRKMA